MLIERLIKFYVINDDIKFLYEVVYRWV